jgi:hypothetical protein
MVVGGSDFGSPSVLGLEPLGLAERVVVLKVRVLTRKHSNPPRDKSETTKPVAMHPHPAHGENFMQLVSTLLMQPSQQLPQFKNHSRRACNNAAASGRQAGVSNYLSNRPD